MSAAPAGEPPADLVILGAGPAGVGAAYRAARAGHRVTLLERADAPGGAAGSLTLAGMRVDHGSHRLHAAVDPAILAALERWADAEPAPLSFGRLGLFVHDNAHHALAMAWAAADALGPEGAFDERAWAAARARFAEHVVES